jgi:hypothetical protein
LAVHNLTLTGIEQQSMKLKSERKTGLPQFEGTQSWSESFNSKFE